MDPNFDEGDLDRLLRAESWDDAHRTLGISPEDESRTLPDYYYLYEVVPLWLYAKECLEEEDEREANRPEPRRTATVDTLPRSILAHIFSFLQLHVNGTQPILPLPASEGTGERLETPYSWLPDIALVCKRWRNAAYAAPSLWTHIDLSFPKEVVRSLLPMSDDQPLDVVCDTAFLDDLDDEDVRCEEAVDWEIKLELVLDEQSRIRTLALNLTSPQYFQAVPFKPFSKSFWPHLLRLALAMATSPSVPREKRTLPYPLLSQNFPRLRILELDGVCINWAESSLDILADFRIRNVGDDKLAIKEFTARCLMPGDGVSVEEG